MVAHRSDDVAPERRRGLSAALLTREPLDLARPPDHPLAQRPWLLPRDVIGEDWIGVPPQFPIDRVLSAIGARTGAARRAVQVVVEELVAEASAYDS